MAGPQERLNRSLTKADATLDEEIVVTCRDLTPRHAEVAAGLFNETGRRRGSLNDCMIAAAALADDAPIATMNVVDFRRFEKSGLKLV